MKAENNSAKIHAWSAVKKKPERSPCLRRLALRQPIIKVVICMLVARRWQRIWEDE